MPKGDRLTARSKEALSLPLCREAAISRWQRSDYQPLAEKRLSATGSLLPPRGMFLNPIHVDGSMNQDEISRAAGRWATDERADLDRLIPELYSELRTLAHQRLRRAPHERSLNTTGLVHAAYLRLIESAGKSFENHDHFLALASRVMRNVLVDSARARVADKRGGGAPVEELHEETWAANVDLDRVTALDEALTHLEQLDERQARLVEQRYFGGLTLEEIAAANSISLATVKRELRSARAWLAARLGP